MHIHRHRGDGGRLGKEVIWPENDLKKDDAIPEPAQGGFDIDGKLNNIKEIVEDIRAGVRTSHQSQPADGFDNAVGRIEEELHAEPGGAQRMVDTIEHKIAKDGNIECEIVDDGG